MALRSTMHSPDDEDPCAVTKLPSSAAQIEMQNSALTACMEAIWPGMVATGRLKQ